MTSLQEGVTSLQEECRAASAEGCLSHTHLGKSRLHQRLSGRPRSAKVSQGDPDKDGRDTGGVSSSMVEGGLGWGGGEVS